MSGRRSTRLGGPVEELYERPASPEQARFLGPCNWIEERLEVRGERLEARGGPRGEGLGPRARTEEVYGQADDRSVDETTLTPALLPGGEGSRKRLGAGLFSPPCLRASVVNLNMDGQWAHPVRPSGFS